MSSDTILAASRVAASPTVAWHLLSDTRFWPVWGPSITSVEAESTTVHTAMRGRVRTPIGLWLPFEVTDVRPGVSWNWQVAGIPATGHVVVPGEEGGEARVAFTGHPLLLPYGLVCRLALHRLDRLARSLAEARCQMTAARDLTSQSVLAKGATGGPGPPPPE